MHVRCSSFAVAFALLTIATPALANEPATAEGSAKRDDANEEPAKTDAVESTNTDVASASAKAKTEQPAEVTVMLHVSSPSIVAVEREETGELVCTSPCDRPVPATGRYRIGGRRPSKPFTLAARDGAAKLTVDPASNRNFWGGIAGLGVGGALVAGGVVALALGYADQRAVPDAGGTVTDTTYTDTMTLGTVLVIAGATAGIWGGATALANVRTTVDGSIVKDPPARGGVQPVRTAGDGPAWSAGRTFFVPIIQGAF